MAQSDKPELPQVVRFTTRSGSIYEVDGLRARRLNNLRGTSDRAGFDGSWKDLSCPPVIKLHQPVWLFWTTDIQPSAEDGAVPATVTSAVAEIE